MPTKEVPSDIQTFVDFSRNATLDDRIRSATGLDGVPALQAKMSSRAQTPITDILIPNKCNAECPFCFYSQPTSLQVEPLTSVVVRNLVVHLRDQGDVVTIYPLEPTTSPKLLPVYRAISAGRALTNGMLLTDNMLQQFRDVGGIQRLAISLEGDVRSFKRMTGGSAAAHTSVITGIERAIKYGMSVELFLTLGKKNMGAIEWVVDKAAELGCESCKILRMIPTGKAQHLPDDEFIKENDMPAVLRRVNALRLRYSNFPIRLNKFGPNFYARGVYNYLAKGSKWPMSQYNCPAVTNQFRGILVTEEGLKGDSTHPVFPCFQAVGFPELQTGEYSPSEGFKTNTWLTPDFLRQNVRGACTDCDYFDICLGDCPITMYAEGKKQNRDNVFEAGPSMCITRVIGNIFGRH